MENIDNYIIFNKIMYILFVNKPKEGRSQKYQSGTAEQFRGEGISPSHQNINC